MKTLIFASILGFAVLATACSNPVEFACNEDTPCLPRYPDRPFCDLQGIHPGSDGIRGTCVANPFDAGLPGQDGATADAQLPDADPTAPDASTTTLTVQLAGNQAGRVISTPPGIDCPGTCSAAFPTGTSVTLDATPSPHALFNGWMGGGCSGLAACTVDASTATTVTAGFGLRTLSAGPNAHECAIVPASGGVRCWGLNNAGQLGAGHTTTIGDNEPASAAPELLAPNVVEVTTGDVHSCAITTAGALRCWGSGASGQLGYGNTDTIGDNTGESTGGTVNVGAPVKQVDAGKLFTCALLDTGAVRCWGQSGAWLGYGHTMALGGTPATIPAMNGDISLGGTATQICASPNHVCAVLADKTVRCWGVGSSGQLGYGNTDSLGDAANETPAMNGPVNVGAPVERIACGGAHTCVILADGKIKCWGEGASGRLGYGTTDDIGASDVPAAHPPIDVGEPVVDLALGASHTCALLESGSVKCWGSNVSGALGYGHTSPLGDAPNEVPSMLGAVNIGGSVVELSAGFATCARLSTGAIRCWGNGVIGLGYGNTNNIGDNENPADAGDVPYIP